MAQSLLLLLWIMSAWGISNIPVDVVFTHVKEPSKEEYARIRSVCNSSFGSNQQRFRDIGTFQYALHSVEKFLPWVRRIHVVTNGAFPCWLRETGKLSFVTHRSIWPPGLRRSQLPTYNSVAIEAHLHRIRGLSEHFIYMNDDMIFTKPHPKSFFFNLTDGSPLTFVKDLFWLPYEIEEVRGALAGTAHPGHLMGSHGPYTARKRDILIVQDRWPTYVRAVSGTRCREASSTLPLQSSVSRHTYSYGPPFWVYQWFSLTHNRSTPVAREVWFLSIFEDPLRFYEHALANMSAVDMLVLNDDLSTEAGTAEMQLAAQREFLEACCGYDLLSTHYGGGPLSYFAPHCELSTDVLPSLPQTYLTAPLASPSPPRLSTREQLEIWSGVKGGGMIAHPRTLQPSPPPTPPPPVKENWRWTLPGWAPAPVPVGVGHWGDRRTPVAGVAPVGTGASLFQQDAPSSSAQTLTIAYVMLRSPVPWRALCAQLPHDVGVILLTGLSGSENPSEFALAGYGPAHLLAQCMRMNYVAFRSDCARQVGTCRRDGGGICPESCHALILSRYRLRNVFALRQCVGPLLVLGTSIPISPCPNPYPLPHTEAQQAWLDLRLVSTGARNWPSSESTPPNCVNSTAEADSTLVHELLLRGGHGNGSWTAGRGGTGRRVGIVVSEMQRAGDVAAGSTSGAHQAALPLRSEYMKKKTWARQEKTRPLFDLHTDLHSHDANADGESTAGSLELKMPLAETPPSVGGLLTAVLTRRCGQSGERERGGTPPP